MVAADPNMEDTCDCDPAADEEALDVSTLRLKVDEAEKEVVDAARDFEYVRRGIGKSGIRGR